MAEERPTPSDHQEELIANRTYKTWLMVALLLFFITLTAMIVLMIITDARKDEREEAFAVTLTAAQGRARQTIVALGVTPTPAPEVSPGEYVFEPVGRRPVYSASEDAASQTIGGVIEDADGEPVDGFRVVVWGDYTPAQTLDTGEIAGLEPGRWALRLDGVIRRRVWVQVAAGERYLSAPVEIVFDDSAPARSAADVSFRQVQPLN